MCVQSFIELSAAVHELSCALRRKTPTKAKQFVAAARTVIIFSVLPTSSPDYNWKHRNVFAPKLRTVREAFSDIQKSYDAFGMTCCQTHNNTNYGLFTPLPFRPLDDSPPGSFAPWLVRPRTWYHCDTTTETLCPRCVGESARGRTSQGRIVQGARAKEPGGEWSRGRNGKGAKKPDTR